MKRKLEADFVPKWKKNMEVKPKNIVRGKKIPAPQLKQPTLKKDPKLTNHEKVKQSRAFRERKIQMLNELVKKTKEAHPNEKRSYREWTLLAMKETQEKLYG